MLETAPGGFLSALPSMAGALRAMAALQRTVRGHLPAGEAK